MELDMMMSPRREDSPSKKTTMDFDINEESLMKWGEEEKPFMNLKKNGDLVRGYRDNTSTGSLASSPAVQETFLRTGSSLEPPSPSKFLQELLSKSEEQGNSTP